MAKLTAEMLKRLVKEEMSRFGKERNVADVAKDTEEVGADEYADSLEKHVDMMKALKIEEAKLRSRYKQIQEQKARLAKLIAK